MQARRVESFPGVAPEDEMSFDRWTAGQGEVTEPTGESSV